MLSANINSRACTSVVGQETLDAMEQLCIRELLSANVTKMKIHSVMLTMKFSYMCDYFPISKQVEEWPAYSFKIYVDFIPRKLHFLISWRCIRAMEANFNCEYINIEIKDDGKYTRILVKQCDNHAYLPLYHENRRQIYN